VISASVLTTFVCRSQTLPCFLGLKPLPQMSPAATKTRCLFPGQQPSDLMCDIMSLTLTLTLLTNTLR
jgi:hypothetical protein